MRIARATVCLRGGWRRPRTERSRVNSGPSRRRSLAIAVDEGLMHRHRIDASRDDLAHVADQLVEFLPGQLIDDRMIALRHDALPDHHLHPARDREHLVGVAEEAAAVAE